MTDDEVYIVNADGSLTNAWVFGHRDDASAYSATIFGPIGRSRYVTTKVLDHADARELIERESGG